mmetsp:Transcript_83517/g.157214  ORF Transcript_83517/g.157214 Transcript_83517/m.157214 type:complete len:85 (-) Transcript_83517:132-386(-)
MPTVTGKSLSVEQFLQTSMTERLLSSSSTRFLEHPQQIHRPQLRQWCLKLNPSLLNLMSQIEQLVVSTSHMTDHMMSLEEDLEE